MVATLPADTAPADNGHSGLTSQKARTLLERHGPNVLPEKPPPTWWQVGLRQLRSPLIYILIVAAAVSVVIGHAQDAGFIGVVVVLNALIGGIQEWKAEKSSQALQHLLRVRARVLRDGEWQLVDAEHVVPGDVVLLESGNRIPADAEVFVSNGLEVDESLLTGESIPVAKGLEAVRAGTTVVRGRARAQVVATGADTAVGEIAEAVMGTRGGRAPLLERMERLTRVIAIAVVVSAALVAVGAVMLRGYGWVDMFQFSVALAVSAIPEGLPVAMTVALAIASNRMSGRGVIVRRLAAVEGLGSCTLIASDKTGTLTCNELTVRRIVLPSGDVFSVSGEGYTGDGDIVREERVGESGMEEERALEDLLRAAVLCNEAELTHGSAPAEEDDLGAAADGHEDVWSWQGDPTDVALLALGWKAGMRRHDETRQFQETGAIPFESERQYAATFHRRSDEAGESHFSAGALLVCVKGAPEKVLEMCGNASDSAYGVAERMAADGLRVLALADASVDGSRAESTQEEFNEEDFSEERLTGNLRFLGFVGMIDPLRPGAVDAIHACHDAGVGVSMITGDHPVTALAIARELGLATKSDQVATGEDVRRHTEDGTLADLVATTRVFARIAPTQKLDIVEAAQAAGHFVAVTGDGVNDAPALRQANIGVAMGRAGTDVARESAELVITDDNIATIVGAVEEGRIAYDNVRKVVFLLLSTGLAEVLMLGAVVVSGWPAALDGSIILPLLPVQILWLNLVTNGIQDVALAFEPGEGNVLLRPPRPPSERIFDRLMLERTVLSALVMSVAGLATFHWMLEYAGWTVEASRNALLLLVVFFQNMHVGNARSEVTSIFRLSPLKSPILMAGVLLALVVHVLAMYAPFMQRILGTSPVPAAHVALLVGVALTVVATMELHKIYWNRIHFYRA